MDYSITVLFLGLLESLFWGLVGVELFFAGLHCRRGFEVVDEADRWQAGRCDLFLALGIEGRAESGLR